MKLFCMATHSSGSSRSRCWSRLLVTVLLVSSILFNVLGCGGDSSDTTEPNSDLSPTSTSE
ncbi:MAG TPA: hypothetical protein GX717_09195, partial [Clostridiaceae bacterium]|nr:hypothetical protein [Clostridiaceae bacterium]